jgi:hypothetical protein
VSACIGCGMVEAPEPCVNACDDRRLELVRAAAHARIVAERDDAARRVAVLAAVAERLAAGAWDPAQARAALRDAGPAPAVAVEEEDVVSGWWCATCGRFEAPQPCLGVCIHRPDELVRLEVHLRVEAQAAAARDRAERLAALARRAAWTRPRPGHEEDSARALADAARRLL